MVNTYNPDDVILAICGYIVDNWDSISLESVSPVSQPVRGIRGKNTRVINRNTQSSLSVTVKQTSNLNKILSQVLYSDAASGNGRLELSLMDKNGGLVFTSVEAFVTGYPTEIFDDTLNTRVWSIHCLSSKRSSKTTGNPISSLLNTITNAVKST